LGNREKLKAGLERGEKQRNSLETEVALMWNEAGKMGAQDTYPLLQSDA
jgi:hypothetical protein